VANTQNFGQQQQPLDKNLLQLWLYIMIGVDISRKQTSYQIKIAIQ
jgi:hypothetical protein